jgi:cobalt-zinc-cadmium efflux system outer membrane protein
MKYSSFRMAIFAILLISTTTVRAIEPSSRTLTLRDAINASLQQHPQLHSFELRAQSLAGQRETAALKPALELSTEIENIAGSGPYQHMDNAEISLALSSVIESRAQRDARATLITARQAALQAEQKLFAQDLAAKVTQHFIAVVAAQEILVVQQQSHRLAQDTINILTKRVEAGRSPSAELLRAKAALALADIARTDAEKNLRLTQIELGKLWGEPDSTEFIALGNLRDPGTATSRSHILKGLENHPDLTLLTHEARIREAELGIARAARATNPEWSAGIRYFGENEESALVFGVRLPLSSGKRASGAIKTAIAEQQLTEDQQHRSTLELKAQLLRLHEEHQRTIEKSIALRDRVLPLLKQAMQETSEAFSKGRYSYMEWSSAQREYLAAELELIEVAAYAHQLRAEVQRFGGSSVVFDNSRSIPTAQGAM